MRSIDLSTMVPVQVLNLNEFEQKTSIHPDHTQFDWATGWNNILQIGLYQKGPDVSEVGSTWLENLIRMNALRSFRPTNLRVLGGESAFYSTTKINHKDEAQLVWSIPWLLDTRLICYRGDSLAQTQITPEDAFASGDALYDTLNRLQAARHPYPLMLATGANSLHILASFLWGRGGDFRSADLRKITLLEPEARQGLLDYFRLYKFIDPQFAQKGYSDLDPLYLAGRGVVNSSGQWLMETIKNQTAEPTEVSQNTRYAAPPGVAYIGGTHLVVWKHCIHEELAMALIQHLTSEYAYQTLARDASIIPARKEVLNSAPFLDDPDYQLVTRLMETGRGFNSGNHWAGIEMRLTAFCEKLWHDLFSNPELNLEAEIERRLRELSARLERTLLSS